MSRTATALKYLSLIAASVVVLLPLLAWCWAR